MANYHPHLVSLEDRYHTFIQKLEERASELENEVKMTAQMVYDEDEDQYKRAYLKFKAGIEGQLNILIRKAREVFETQIRPLRDDRGYGETDVWYDKVYEVYLDFEKSIYKKIKNAFKDVKERSSEEELKEILNEYEAIKEAFNCSQCGANVPIDQMYFVATYITCPFCQTQNTFNPSTKMKSLQFLAREVGEERHKNLEKLCDRDRSEGTTVESFWLYYQYRAMVWLESAKIVPILKKENADVFYREMHDIVSYYSRTKFSELREFYQQILDLLDYHKLEIEVLPEDKNLLLELSINYLKKLGHFDKYQDLYNQKLEQLEQLEQLKK